MSHNPLSTYTFLPYVRQGLSNKITELDDPTRAGARVTTHVHLVIKGDKVDGSGTDERTVSKDVELYGPGDIVGIDRKAIF